MRCQRAAGVGAIAAALSLMLTSPAGADPGRAAAETASAPVAVIVEEHERRVPFTSLDLALLFAGGTGLIAAGAGVRRAARTRA